MKEKGEKVFIGTEGRPPPAQKKKLKLKLERILSDHNIALVKFYRLVTGFLVITGSPKDTERMFSPQNIKAIKDANMKVKVHPEHRARRTVLAKRLDKEIFEQYSEEAIRKHITEKI